MRLLRVACVGALGCFFSFNFALSAGAAASQPEPAVETSGDSLTSALVAMGQAQVGEEVLAAWLGQQGEIPRLTGEQLARLKTAGLTDAILLRLVRGEGPALAAPAVAVAQGTGAKMRVLVQSSSAVEYCELALDGALIASRGRLVDGAVPAGGRAPQPKPLSLRQPTVLFEGDIPPGRHQVQTGFVMSRVQEEFGDLRQGRRQRVLAEGVRALEASAEDGTACTVAPGEVCVVTARFRKTGRQDYAISYDTVVLSEGEAEVQAARWATAGP